MLRPTSAECYRQITESGLLRDLQLAVYLAVANAGYALTDSEIAAAIGKPRDTASPRVRELVKREVLAWGETRKCELSGRKCRTVDVTDKLPEKQILVARTARPARVPREDLREAIKALDETLRCVLLDREQRRAGNRARDILSKHL